MQARVSKKKFLGGFRLDLYQRWAHSRGDQLISRSNVLEQLGFFPNEAAFGLLDLVFNGSFMKLPNSLF